MRAERCRADIDGAGGVQFLVDRNDRQQIEIKIRVGREVDVAARVDGHAVAHVDGVARGHGEIFWRRNAGGQRDRVRALDDDGHVEQRIERRDPDGVRAGAGDDVERGRRIVEYVRRDRIVEAQHLGLAQCRRVGVLDLQVVHARRADDRDFACVAENEAAKRVGQFQDARQIAERPLRQFPRNVHTPAEQFLDQHATVAARFEQHVRRIEEAQANRGLHRLERTADECG